MDIQEPAITQNDLLVLDDDRFNEQNVCLLTGVGSGIGRAMSLVAAANRLMVVGLDVSEEEGRKTESMARDLGGQMVFVKADLTRDEDIEKAVEEAAGLGNIRFLANIAGIQHIASVDQFPMETYDRMQRIMLRAPFYLSKLCIPYMKKNDDGAGVIGHMASIHAHICTINKPVYNMLKFGLRGLAQSISAEGEGKIRSFTVSTGFVKTSMTLNQISPQAEQRGMSSKEVVEQVMLGKSRLKEMMAPVDVANLFLFGFSRHSRHLFGGDLLFDGGMVLTY